MKEKPDIDIMEEIRKTEQKEKIRFTDEANFVRHTNRRCGRRRDLMGPDHTSFVEPKKYPDLKPKLKQFKNDWRAQRVMRIFLENAEGNYNYACKPDVILSDFNDACPVDSLVRLSTLKSVMNELVKNVIFEKKNGLYKAKHLGALRCLCEQLDDLDDSDTQC